MVNETEELQLLSVSRKPVVAVTSHTIVSVSSKYLLQKEGILSWRLRFFLMELINVFAIRGQRGILLPHR